MRKVRVFAYSIAITLACGLGVLAVVFFGCSVPVRQFENQTWLRTETLSALPTDAKIKRMARAATRDHYVAPIKGLPRKLIFLQAASVAPNDVYLIFRPAEFSDITVRYRGDRDSERLYWKTIVSE
jgi:hypothetical protein